jgi:hypothetical protein
MAKASGLSGVERAGDLWRAFVLQPHRTESFKLSKDPLFIDKVRNAVGLFWTRSAPARALHPNRSIVLNMVERFFAEITERQNRRGVYRSVKQQQILAYIEQRNATSRPFQWAKTADEILDAVKCFCLRTLQENSSLYV